MSDIADRAARVMFEVDNGADPDPRMRSWDDAGDPVRDPYVFMARGLKQAGLLRGSEPTSAQLNAAIRVMSEQGDRVLMHRGNRDALRAALRAAFVEGV